MLTEQGRVVALEEDAVWVETVRQSTCGACSARKGCGHGLLHELGGRRGHRVRALSGAVSPAACNINDRVLISVPESLLLRGSFIVYMVPLLGLLAGAAMANGFLVGWPELAAPVGAVCGFVVGILGVRWHARRHRGDPELHPTLVEVLGHTVEQAAVE